LGVFILSVMILWIAFLIGLLTRSKTHILSGIFFFTAGVYLLVSLFILFNPSKLRALAEFITRDIVQLQHVAIGFLLIAGGLVDILVGHHRLQSLIWQIIWYVNNFLVGAIFLAHPERNLNQTVSHQFLGLSLIVGPTCLLIDKLHDLWLQEMWVHQLAAFSYSSATMIMLFVYKEPAHEHYIGLDYRCIGSCVLTFVSIGIAGVTIILVCIYHVLLNSNCPSLTGDRNGPLKMEFGRITALLASRNLNLSVPTASSSSTSGIFGLFKRVIEWFRPTRGTVQGSMYSGISQLDPDQIPSASASDEQELHRDESGKLQFERKRSRNETDSKLRRNSNG